MQNNETKLCLICNAPIERVKGSGILRVDNRKYCKIECAKKVKLKQDSERMKKLRIAQKLIKQIKEALSHSRDAKDFINQLMNKIEVTSKEPWFSDKDAYESQFSDPETGHFDRMEFEEPIREIVRDELIKHLTLMKEEILSNHKKLNKLTEAK
ncbi:MAG: hypothetical protein QS98_C0010G0059 [archaeon GW2011_AR3]|nr:MAG: hypothetical protein QS98_C0010G0059 [archaeon GW2011_AR3]MBS3110198.1 hypothetical protein [Candidatus Woesearchaeota archaeon]